MVQLIHYISTSDQCWYVKIILPEKESQYLTVHLINYISTSDQSWYVRIILLEK